MLEIKLHVIGYFWFAGRDDPCGADVYCHERYAEERGYSEPLEAAAVPYSGTDVVRDEPHLLLWYAGQIYRCWPIFDGETTELLESSHFCVKVTDLRPVAIEVALIERADVLLARQLPADYVFRNYPGWVSLWRPPDWRPLPAVPLLPVTLRRRRRVE